jgi:hypothetical protein
MAPDFYAEAPEWAMTYVIPQLVWERSSTQTKAAERRETAAK